MRVWREQKAGTVSQKDEAGLGQLLGPGEPIAFFDDQPGGLSAAMWPVLRVERRQDAAEADL